MSRKSRRTRREPGDEGTPQARHPRRSVLVAGFVAALLALLVVAIVVYQKQAAEQSAAAEAEARAVALASDHAPTLGDPAAKVHVVEFLDPACETCALFFPLVKQWMAQNPGRIRLSVRHVAFHGGADYVVRVLEASRRQGLYWQTLEALLASQPKWVPHHQVQQEQVLPAIAGVGLDLGRLAADMDAPDVAERMERDRSDAVTLKVVATPEYFVNGRPLPRFGEQQLQTLVLEELRKAY